MSSQSRGVSHLEEVLPLNALQEAMENFIDQLDATGPTGATGCTKHAQPLPKLLRREFERCHEETLLLTEVKVSLQIVPKAVYLRHTLPN